MGQVSMPTWWTTMHSRNRRTYERESRRMCEGTTGTCANNEEVCESIMEACEVIEGVPERIKENERIWRCVRVCRRCVKVLMGCVRVL